MKTDDINILADEFVTHFRNRLEIGAVEYGNKSFGKPAPVLQREILEELEDYAVWSFILWTKVRKLSQGIAAITDEAQNGGRKKEDNSV